MNAGGRVAHRAVAISPLPIAIVLTLMSVFVVAVPTAVGATPGAVAAAPMSARQALRFWTPARMKRARPMESPVAGHGGVAGRSVTVPGGGTAHQVPALVPAGGASASSTFEEVADPTSRVSRQNGVIFFTAGFFGLGRCSGTSVNAPNLSVVITAGHCVNSGGSHGQWYRQRWVFVPGYRYGQRPFGVFPARWLDATRPWLATSSENFDVGAAVVGRNGRGQRLAAAVGGAGIAWGLKADQVFDVHGYPVEEPFDGETQRLCAQTPFLGHDPLSFLVPGPLNLAVDCNVSGGASGGGWTVRGDVLNGVTDYGFPDDPATAFGAYFGREVARLYGRAAKVR